MGNRWRWAAAALLVLVGGGCAHGGNSDTASAPPPPTRPIPHFTLHWNDAGDTTRTLRWPSDKPFRTALTMTGLVDSLQGFTIQFRLEPTTTNKGTAWKFANSDGCLAAIWSGTAEKDPKARAPWPNKLLITDVKALPDGSVGMVVAATFDLVGMHPDSTYSLCHMDFVPPQPASAGAVCAGWDAPMRIYVENATLLFTTVEQPVFEMGKPIFFEPIPASRP